MMVVFDIDGTLCRTSQVDDDCWSRMACEVLGLESISTDWSDYPHSTDGAIAEALVREHLGHDPDPTIIAGMQDRFVELLHEAHDEDPDLFQETPGAGVILEYLSDRGVDIAIATGGWTRSARFKLRKAGLDRDDVAAAFACDAHPREAIIAKAIERACQQCAMSPPPAKDVTYVGDGVWDLRAANRMGIGFIGIASGERARDLLEAGATTVFPDFNDPDALYSALSPG